MRRPVLVRYAVPLCLVALSACSADLTLPDGATVTCTTASDCPSGYTCVLEASRCVRTDASFDVARVVAASVAIAPELPRARGAKATVGFALDRAVKAAPTVRLAWLGGDAGATLLSAGADGKTFSYEYTVGTAEPEGSLTLVIDTVSDAGVPSRFEKTRAIELDFTPPVLVPDTLSTTYALPANAVVDTVTAIGLGGHADLLFAVNEATTGAVTLELEPAEALGQSCGAPVGSFYSCAVPLAQAPAAQGAHAVFANVTDVAGNSARLALGTITLDTVAPPAPDVVTAGRIVYTRAPHGSDATGGQKAFSIAASAGAVEAGARLVVFDGAQTGGASLIGRGDTNAAGAAAAIPLVPADRARVYVAAVDAAGNVSDADAGTAGAQAVQVRDVEWVATLAGKVALDTFSNPHRLRAYGVLPAGTLSATAPEQSDFGRFARRDGLGLPLDGAGSWLLLDPRSAPSNTTYLAYTDTWRGELRALALSFLGATGVRFSGGAWLPIPVLDPEFDGNPELADNGMAFDAQRGEVVNTTAGATWVFTGQSWRFVGSDGMNLSEATTVYDDNLGKVILFGGISAAGAGAAVGDTWAFDGTGWEVVATTGPQPRYGAVAVFDPSIGKVVLHGGFRVLPAGQTDCGGGLTAVGTFCSYRDTWLWDGKAWTRACDSTTADCGVEPTPRSGAKFAYDPVRKRAVLFGGGYTPACQGTTTELCSDFYEWDGAAWSRPTPVDPGGDGSAHGRVTHVMGWDPLGARFVLSGGEDEFESCLNSAFCRETWQWNGSDWRLIADPSRAAPTLVQGGGVFAFDAARGELVLANPTNDSSTNTWVYNGGVWTVYTVGHPPLVNSPASTGSPNGVFRFGGGSGATYSGELYRRQGTTWAAMPWTSRPLARAQAGLAAVLSPGYVLMYGGTYQTHAAQPTCSDGSTGTCYMDDTWGYGVWGTPTCSSAGTTCWRSFGAGPPRRSSPVLVGTTGTGAVLFGGRSPTGFPLSDTWRWDGASWTQVTGAAPPARYSPVFAYDARRGKTVIASGTAPDPTSCGATSLGLSCPDVWEFDGAAWRQRRVADPEGDGGLQIAFGVGAYSTDGGVYSPGEGGFGRLFRWDGGFAQRPALVAEFDLSAAGAPVGTVVERVELAATAKASASAAGAASTGVELLAGEPLGWRAVATADPGTGFANLAWCASRTAAPGCEVVREGKLLLGRAGTILVGAAPAGTNGTGVATVTLDYVEAKVRYRMPDPAEE